MKKLKSGEGLYADQLRDVFYRHDGYGKRPLGTMGRTPDSLADLYAFREKMASRTRSRRRMGKG